MAMHTACASLKIQGSPSGGQVSVESKVHSHLIAACNTFSARSQRCIYIHVTHAYSIYGLYTCKIISSPHVCPYVPLPNNGMWCKCGHPSDIGNLYVIIGISTLLARLMTIPRSRQGTQVFDHSTYTLITVSNTSHARRW